MRFLISRVDVCVIAAFLRTESRVDYASIEMDDFGGQ
jgi:hypothetical protein